MAEYRPVSTSGARRTGSGHGAGSPQPTGSAATKSAARAQLEQGRTAARQARQANPSAKQQSGKQQSPKQSGPKQQGSGQQGRAKAAQRGANQPGAGGRATVPKQASAPARESVTAPAAFEEHLSVVPAASFDELGVPRRLVEALTATGITAPFPIQSATLPDSLHGRDVLGRGRTGSGKTLAFVLPVLARLAESGHERRPGSPRALILAPTRELATQIHETIEPLARRLRLRSTTVFGGVGAGPQITALRAGVDVLVACPGRLEDHLGSGNASLDAVEITVLDEADHMADLGFLPAVKRLLDRTPRDGQRLLFSATLDNGINQLVERYLHEPVTHSVDSAQSPISTMTHHVLHIAPEHRLPVLVDLAAAPGRTIMFTRTKHGARKLAKQLAAANIPAVELHGNLAHNARTRNLAAFSSGEATTLVATDIAARGIHVDEVTLVVHADPPVEHKAYLHRSGRTARAGASGTVITLMTDAQRSEVKDLTRKAGISPTTTKLAPGDPLLQELAPGERTFMDPEAISGLTGAAPKQGAKPQRAGAGATGGKPESRRAEGRRAEGRKPADGRKPQAARSQSSQGSPRSDGSQRSQGSPRSQGSQGSQAAYSMTAKPQRYRPRRRPGQGA